MVTKIAMMVSTPAGAHLLSFSCERMAAQAAESILREMPVGAVPAPVWISCRDPSVAQRLVKYLEDVQDEMTSVTSDA